ncbi:Fe-S-cluster-containing dehydrogenase component [Halanaeroarchaeum sp. HSR-CO]|uniref:4Fe-4S dicluster domain-containing protein n=1 Tax=Halanaeroarchaeum sp. HSR-CO TaxID=2866382 RepID=UPI00217E3281|nr:4Fe-4S dicluster domain-containing protein [Halanaeroarchaeum sp. HSR-CO]UWG49087.1 Fe-S-cluster-containing dehydrogenase component [Halanaeroarchaeum sp. HSR-CO]
MSDSTTDPGVPDADDDGVDEDRRHVLKATAGAATFAIGGVAASQQPEAADLLQKHYKKMDATEREQLVDRLESRLQEEYDTPEIEVSTTKPPDDTVFGYALNVEACIGCRQCVYACADENNISRETEENPASNQLHWIRVLRFEDSEIEVDPEGDGPIGMDVSSEFGDVSAGVDWEESDHYYDPEAVPEEDAWYLPVQCQQCEDPSCTEVCPVQATWKEKDGIVVVDYDRCIGCKYCVTNCPYDARRFNFSHPELPDDEVNPEMHYLGNRPRPGEVVEKCTFCVQRTREGEYPACVDACPVGARKFGNLLDESGEIRTILDEKPVFRLRPELGTEPKFFYFTE